MTIRTFGNLLVPPGLGANVSGSWGTTSLNAFGDALISTNQASAAGAWPANNRAIFVPCELYQYTTIYKAWVNIGSSSGNLDFGLYDIAGNLLGSAGSTGSPGSGFNVISLTAFSVPPGVYFMAMAASSTGLTVSRWNTPATQVATSFGLGEMSTAFPLPSTATIIANASTYVPLFGFVTRSDGVQ